MPSPTSIARDLRALGTSAPLRAAYEASKRTGFHRVLFRGRAARRPYRSQPLSLGTHIPESSEARERCLADARLILDEGLRVFGRRVATGIRGRWSLDPLTGKEWASDIPWWEVDIRSESRLSDVKFVWEAARHRDLVVLARAAVLEPDGPWFDTLERLLREWCEQCPPEQGVNWYSSLELALRAIAWSQVLALVGGRFDSPLRQEMDGQLIASARHIMVELPYTLSSMKNNHLLGDGLGLVFLGRMFPEHPGSQRWQRIGDYMFAKQLARHMRPDGSMIEDSLSYHRFVLEMLIVRVLIGGAKEEVLDEMTAAARHLEALGVLEGPVPQYGDWDEGRVLADSAEAGCVSGSTWAALVLSGASAEPKRWDDFDELAWYCPESSDVNGASGSRANLSPLEQVRRTGDWFIARHGEWVTWFKVGSGESHQHSDVTSFFTRRDSEWVIRDPGTGTYNGPLHVRNGFRASSAHPVWVPDQEDQLVPHRAFRWLRSVSAFTADPIQVADLTLIACWHDAFEASHGSRVGRILVLAPQGIAVVDAVEAAAASQKWTLAVTLASPASASFVHGLPDPKAVSGQDHPFRGWHSETYGAWTPSTWLQTESLFEAPITWSVAARKHGDGPTNRPRLHNYDVRAEWEEDGLHVQLSQAGAEVERLEVLRA